MIKAQWDVWEFAFGFDSNGKPLVHPCVIISPPHRCGERLVNVLKCSSVRATAPPKFTQAILDAADGLDWATACECDRLWLVPSAELKNRRETVSQRAPASHCE
jgi:hypothetical protein